MPHDAVDHALDRAEDPIARRGAAAEDLGHVAAEERRGDEDRDDERRDEAASRSSSSQLLREEQGDHQVGGDQDRDHECDDVVTVHARPSGPRRRPRRPRRRRRRRPRRRRTTSSVPTMRAHPCTYATAIAKNAITTATKITSVIACSCSGQHASHLVGDGNADDAGLERRPDTGSGDQHEATDLAAVAQHGQLDSIRGQGEVVPGEAPCRGAR